MKKNVKLKRKQTVKLAKEKSSKLELLRLACVKLLADIENLNKQVSNVIPLSSAQVFVLEVIFSTGAKTAPQLAHKMKLSRQRVHVLLATLQERRYVKLVPNPLHQNSKNIVITARGQESIRMLRERRDRRLTKIALKLKMVDLITARQLLERINRDLGRTK